MKIPWDKRRNLVFGDGAGLEAQGGCCEDFEELKDSALRAASSGAVSTSLVDGEITDAIAEARQQINQKQKRSKGRGKGGNKVSEKPESDQENMDGDGEDGEAGQEQQEGAADAGHGSKRQNKNGKDEKWFRCRDQDLEGRAGITSEPWTP